MLTYYWCQLHYQSLLLCAKIVFKDIKSSEASLCLYELQNTIYSYVILIDDKFERVIPPGIVEPCFNIIWKRYSCWDIPRVFVPRFDSSNV